MRGTINPQERIDPVQLDHGNEKRDERNLKRNHERCQDDPEAQSSPNKTQASQGECCQRIEQQRYRGHAPGKDYRVEEEPGERDPPPDIDVGLHAGRTGQDVERVPKDIPFALQGRPKHPDERQYDDQRSRDQNDVEQKPTEPVTPRLFCLGSAVWQEQIRQSTSRYLKNLSWNTAPIMMTMKSSTEIAEAYPIRNS